MTDIERHLLDLGSGIDFPETPNLAPGVIARIAGPIPHTARRLRAIVAVAAAVVGILIAILPGPRAAIADLLGIGAVRIEIVDSLPPAEPIGSVPGRPVGLKEARDQVGFEILTLPVPADRVYVDSTVDGGMVTLVYEQEERGIVLAITQLAGTTDEAILKKILGQRTTLTTVEADNGPAYWIDGDPHIVVYSDVTGTLREDHPRLAGNTLVLMRDGVTIRIEGDISLSQALDIVDELQ